MEGDATRVVLPSLVDLIFGLGAWILFFGAMLALVIYVTRDMNARGREGWAWGLLVVLAPFLGVLVWLIVRANSPRVSA